MIEVDLKRGYRTDAVTLGMLQIKGVKHDPIYTLENPWKFNKVRVSCIPTGRYECEPYSGTKYKDVYIVKNVVNRSAILIHWGNYERNTAGCVLLGMASGPMNGEAAIQNSKKAVNYFKELIGKNKFILNIGE